MKYAFAAIAIALIGTIVSIEAYPQSLSGALSSNPNGGADAFLQLSQGFGTKDHNVIGSTFAAGNTNGGPITTGGALNYNLHGHGLSLMKEHVSGVRDTFKQGAHVNLFKNDAHSLNANAFASQNTLANGFKFDRNGGGLNWDHIKGHGASATFSNIPNFGSQLELGGKANLWSSADRATSLNLNAGASRWLSGPLSGQNNFNAGLGLTHTFG